MLTKDTMKRHGRYHWKHNPEPSLIYLGGEHYSGDRRTWHRFAKVEAPSVVWCEVLDDDLYMLEETAGGDHAN